MKILNKFAAGLLAVVSVVVMASSAVSCTRTELTDSTEFAVYFAGGTDIGPSMSMNLPAPTWKGQTPSDFAIYRVTLEGELYETDSFTIDPTSGIISIRNTDDLDVGLYSLSISCVSGGRAWEFPDAVTVNMMNPVPEGITVKPSSLAVSLESIRGAIMDTDLPTAQVTTDGNHISITSYSIANVRLNGAAVEAGDYFSIDNSGLITITPGNMDITPGEYTLDIRLTTAIADAESEEGIFTDALAIDVTSPPLGVSYSTSPARVEQGYGHTSSAPQLNGSSAEVNYSIRSVSPETAASAFSIDPATGVITLAENNGLEIGTVCTVSLTVSNAYGTADFDDVYEVTIVDYIAPVTTFSYGDLTIIQAQEISHPYSEMDGDEVTFAFGESLDPQVAEYLSIDEVTGLITAAGGHGIPMGTWTVPVTATNVKGSLETMFTLQVNRNPYYFTYVSWGNNIGLEPVTDYASQFRYETRTSGQTVSVAETDLPDGVPVTWAVEGLTDGAPDVTIDQSGTLTLRARNSGPRVDAYLVTVTAGEGLTGETSLRVPVFIFTRAAADAVRIEYTPFVFQVNPRTGGRSASPEITGVADMSQFYIDYRSSFGYWNLNGPESHVSGTVSANNPGCFMGHLWDSYWQGTLGQASSNYGAKAPMSYYENNGQGSSSDNRNPTMALGYTDPSDYSVVINPGRFVYDNAYADGFMIGQMSWITDGASYDNASALETAISGGTRQYLLAIWFDTDFVNE